MTDKEILERIVFYCKQAKRFTGDNIQRSFVSNELLVSAVECCIFKISALAQELSDDLKAKGLGSVDWSISWNRIIEWKTLLLDFDKDSVGVLVFEINYRHLYLVETYCSAILHKM